MQIVDRTSNTGSITHNLRGFQILSRSGSTRPVGAINSMVLHQTGFSRGNSVDAYDTVIAHYVVLPSGTVLRLRELEALLNNAHSRASVSVEFVGNFPPRPRRDAQLPTKAQVDAGQGLVRHVRSQISGRLSHIFAHRQFNPGAKGNCPGPHIWYNVGYWAENCLGLSHTISSPGSIPRSWEDPQLAIGGVGTAQVAVPSGRVGAGGGSH